MGGTNTKIGLMRSGVLLESTWFATRPERHPAAVLDELAGVVRALLDGQRATAAGLAIAGFVEDGRFAGGLNLPGWDDLPIQDAMERRLGIPVRVVMDATAAATAEALVGGHGDDIYVLTMGTGVGGAAVLGGVVCAGAAGHVIGPDLQYLEDVASARAIVARASAFLPSEPPPTTETALRAADEGVAGAQAVWEDAGFNLGVAAATISHLLLVRAVVVGGGVAEAGEMLLEPAQRSFAAHLLPGLRGRCNLARSSLGPLAGVLGAGILAVLLLDSPRFDARRIRLPTQSA